MSDIENAIDTKLIDVAMDSLFGNDKPSMNEFLELCIKDIVEFSALYQQSMEERDLMKLREVAHKYKSVHKLLGLEAILQEADHGKLLLTENTTDSDSIAKTNSSMSSYCVFVEEYLVGRLRK